MTATAVESLIVYLALLLGALFTLIAALRTRTVQLRTIPAYQSLPHALDATVAEMSALLAGELSRHIPTAHALAAMSGVCMIVFLAFYAFSKPLRELD